VSREELVALVCCDLGAIVRGRSVLGCELEGLLDQGVSWVPANQALTPHGPLAEASPFGPIGDLRLLPDPGTRARVAEGPARTPLDLVLCDIVETDGRSWGCCCRSFLRGALAELETELGARARASFEHEFQLLLDSPAAPPFSLEAQRRAEPFAGDVMNALVEAGVEPERLLAEYASHQFEIPVAPAEGLASADRAVILREVVRDTARALGLRASFVPLLDPAEAGNGVHVHLGLLDAGGASLLYDPDRPARLSEIGGSFAAGILRHAGALSALTAASPVSGARLRPHRWSAGSVCLATQNREALLRIPPLVALGAHDPAAQLHLEYRGADAAANPYLALGAILHAGLAGVREGLPTPPLLDEDPARLDPAAAERFGVGALPETLAQSIAALAEDEVAREWLGPLLHDAYASVKRAEIEAARNEHLEETCRRYGAIY
jgi:glutamine synthetase